MQAVILAGGRGTRLKPYTITLPKPLVPVGEQPILSIILTQLKVAGVNSVTLAVNHMAELIMRYFQSGEDFGLTIDYSVENVPLGTVGPLKLLKDLPDNFIVMNGDILTDLDYMDLYNAHLRSGAALTVATYQREIVIDFGVLGLDDTTTHVREFREKPTYHINVSMGIYVFTKTLLEWVPAGKPYGFDNLVLDLLSANAPIHAYRFGGYWLDLGRPDDYDRANQDVALIPAFKNLKLFTIRNGAPGSTLGSQ